MAWNTFTEEMTSMGRSDTTEMGPVAPSHQFPPLQQINFYFFSADVF